MRLQHFVIGLMIATLLPTSTRASERLCTPKELRINPVFVELRVLHDGTIEWNGTPISDKQFRNYAAQAVGEENKGHPVRFHFERHLGDGDNRPLRQEAESLGARFLDCGVISELWEPHFCTRSELASDPADCFAALSDLDHPLLLEVQKMLKRQIETLRSPVIYGRPNNPPSPENRKRITKLEAELAETSLLLRESGDGHH